MKTTLRFNLEIVREKRNNVMDMMSVSKNKEKSCRLGIDSFLVDLGFHKVL